jgi:hypothetical protein
MRKTDDLLLNRRCERKKERSMAQSRRAWLGGMEGFG